MRWSNNALSGGGAAPGLGLGRFPPSETLREDAFLRGFFSSISGGSSQPMPCQTGHSFQFVATPDWIGADEAQTLKARARA